MDTVKRIEIAARLLANMMPELLSATDETRAKMGRQALDWVDALEEVAIGDRPGETVAPEYPWDTAPEWANWAATDENGEQWFFEKEPNTYVSDWVKSPGSDCALIRRGKGHVACPNWRNTLRPRPKALHA